MDILIENFQEANPDIAMKTTPFSYADHRTKVVAGIPAGEAADVVQLLYAWLGLAVTGKEFIAKASGRTPPSVGHTVMLGGPRENLHLFEVAIGLRIN